MNAAVRLAAMLIALPSMAAAQAMDAANPSCPKVLNFSTYPLMKFTLDTSTGQRVLKAGLEASPRVGEEFARKLLDNEHGWVAEIIARTAAELPAGLAMPRKGERPLAAQIAP